MDKSFKDFINIEFLQWLEDNFLQLKEVSSNLFLICSNKYCIKIYDRAGHGYSFTANLAQFPSEDIYQEDEITSYWVFRFFSLKEQYNFSSRTKEEYMKNIPIFIQDLQTLVNYLNKISSPFWEDIKSFISNSLKEARAGGRYKE